MSQEEIQVCDDFYKFVNREWFAKDIPIPPQYSRWGSFIQLADNAIKTQIAMLVEMEKKEELSSKEKKVMAVWKASNDRFDQWEAGEGDLTQLLADVQAIKETFGDLSDVKSYAERLGKVLADFRKQHISSPIGVEVDASMEDSNSMLLHFIFDGLSLPTRGHYFDDGNKNQRDLFKVHLENVAQLVGTDHLVDSFAERVFRFETKLAMITVTQAQRRKEDEFYTITTLGKFLSDVNEHKALDDKKANFEGHQSHPLVETLPDVLGDPDFVMSEEDKELMDIIVSSIMEVCEIPKALAANCKEHYPAQSGNEERVNRVVVMDGDYWRRVFPLLTSENDRQDVVAFLQYKLIKSASSLCTVDLDEEFFNFYNRQLRGQKEQKSREERSVEVVNAYVGMLFGQSYVKKYFPESEKANIHSLIKEVIAAMEDSLKTLDWMTDATREKALKKLTTFTPKLAYPDKWKSYKSLKLKSGENLQEIVKKVKAFEFKVDFIDKINSPKDKYEWHMTPQTVNAYYSPSSNEICFPAAILQPPFYYKNLEDVDSVEFDFGGASRDLPGLLDALNCGGICAVIAHEIGHGFDDQGSKYDGAGNLVNWWADEDRKMFQAKCDLMAKQVLEYELHGDDGTVYKMKPDLVMGECLADVAGVSLGVKAMLRKVHKTPSIALPKKKTGILQSFFAKSYEKKLAAAKAAQDQAEEAAAKDRLEYLKLFCRSWGTIWRGKQTMETAITFISMDPHAPGSFRGNLIKNIPEFYEAFEIPSGSSMYVSEEERVKLW